MQLDLLIKNAHIVNHDSEFDGWVGVKGEKIVAEGEGECSLGAARQIDCSGKALIPGIIDPHVHLGAWHEKWLDIREETKCAAAGGVTTVCWYYRHSEPYYGVYEKICETINQYAHVDVLCHMGIQCEEHARSIPDLYRKYGTRFFKLHMGYSKGNSLGLNPADDGTLYLSLKGAREASPKVYVALHAENTQLIERLAKELQDQGRDDLAAWTESRPYFCEEEIIARAIYYAKLTGGNLYLPHTTIASGAELAARARAQGVNVIVETCPHYLNLFMDDPNLGNVGKVSPPLRTREEAEKLWDMINRGFIATIGSDHVACDKASAQGSDSIWTAVPGFAGVETLLPLMLSTGVNQGRITLQKLVEICAYNPAGILGIRRKKGFIGIGADADMVVVDLGRKETIKQGKLRSPSTTPYDGLEVTGWPVTTILRGRVIAHEGEILAEPGYGRHIV